MNEIVAESSLAHCELCRTLKPVRMIGQSASNKGNHRDVGEVAQISHIHDRTKDSHLSHISNHRSQSTNHVV